MIMFGDIAAKPIDQLAVLVEEVSYFKSLYFKYKPVRKYLT